MGEYEKRINEIIEELSQDATQESKLGELHAIIASLKHNNPTQQKIILDRVCEKYKDDSWLHRIFEDCIEVGDNKRGFIGEITDEFVVMASDFGIKHYLYIGDEEGLSDPYSILDEKVKELDLLADFDEIMCIVQETVDEYFGHLPPSIDAPERMDKYIEYEDDNFYCEISTFKQANAACCTERATLTQNLLNHLGYHITFVETAVINNSGKRESHHYNLLSFDNKYFIIDSTMPTIHNGKSSPLICEISKEQYDIISSDFDQTNQRKLFSEPITVSHYNPLQDKDYKITYAPERTVDKNLKLGSNSTYKPNM